MELENILKLIETVSESSLTSFTLDDGNSRLVLECNPVKESENAAVLQATKTMEHAERVNEASEVSAVAEASGNVVKSPLVGVFYSAPSPEADDFVKVGDEVKKGQTLGIIEAMKLMNEIESEYDGVVREILINNEDVAGYGQPLFVIA